jgi:cell division protein ZapA (FtsZ GTPase activity inhibitor)
VKRTIKIHIAGQQYVLRSDADEGYVQSLADFVNARINALKGNRQVATQSDVVLAALKLADELQHERQAQARLRSQAREHVQGMLDRLTLVFDQPPKAEGKTPVKGAGDAAPPAATAKGRASRSSQKGHHQGHHSGQTGHQEKMEKQ